MIKKLHNTLFFIGISLFTLNAQANTEKKEIPQYQVEMIVFETTALRGWTEETWPIIDYDFLLDGSVPAVSLPDENFLLTEVAAKLQPKKGYRILVHQSWNIFGLPELKSTPIQFENAPQNLYQTKALGTMRFYKSRYAHIDLDLSIERYIPKKVREKFAEQQYLDINNMPDHWRFEHRASRKIKTGELHYIDHPLFGALLKIQRIKQD